MLSSHCIQTVYVGEVDICHNLNHVLMSDVPTLLKFMPLLCLLLLWLLTFHDLQQVKCVDLFDNPTNWYVERERNVFYLTMHSTHFIYGYMASDIWLRTILILRKETRCRHMVYSFRLTARVLLYAPSHRQDST